MAADPADTTVGGIVGKLRMDRDEWIAAMAATKRDILELERSDPDIHIDTNAAEVVSKMAAAKAATDALGDSQEDLGRKTRKSTDETIRANEANKTSVTRVGAIVTAVALLAPLLAPVGAAAVGLGGAFLGMGAAGVAALFGIHQEMKNGTATGQAYEKGLDTLQASFAVLSRTAAVAMLSSFRRVVDDTSAAMPMLNKQVGQFSTLLGQAGAAGVSGTISALRVLNPLFLTAGMYVRSLAEGFERWANGTGIEEFNGYALSTFPMVVDVLGKLASMVMHILEALAPLGTIGLAVLTGIADVITAIPVEVLSQLIVTVTWGAVAFKAWGFIAPMLSSIATTMGAVGAATTIATGPIGWVVAGLAALAGIFAVVVASNTGATRAMQDYTQAVQADSGAIGENIRQKAAQKLLDSGAIEIAKKLGISTQLVLDATLGNAAARKQLNGLLGEGLISTVQITRAVDENAAAISGEVGRYKDLQGMLSETTEATKQQQWADEAAASALGISADALQKARAGQDGVTDSTAKATAEMYLQGDAAGLLRQKLDLLNGKAISLAEAQNQFESQLVRIPDFADDASASLDGMSEAAVGNRGTLLDLIQSAQNMAQAYRDQGASSDETKQKLIDSKQAIEDQAVAHGMNRDAVHAYLDELFKIPESIPKTKVEVDTAYASAQVSTFLAQVSNRVATIQVRATLPDLNGAVSGSGRPGVAMGGTIRGLAGGGSAGTVTGPGTAGSDTAGLFRLARGEEVISNVFGQADRNRAVLKQINAGYTPTPVTSPSPVSTTAPGANVQVDVHVTVLKNEEPEVVANIVGRGVNDALARAGVNL